MSSYIIAGSADSLDTAYCQQIARRIQSKYNKIDFRIVIKHPQEWEEYLQQICRIYGFLNKSNPIIYTYHGKIVGNKDAFIDNAVKYFGLAEESLIIPNLTNSVNIKLADEQLKRKNIHKNNVKTLQQKIDYAHQKLLKSGKFSHQFKDSEQFLVNGIQYRLRNVQGMCSNVQFPYQKQIKIQKQIIQPENIDLLALSVQDKIPDDTNQAFVTNNQQQLNTESMEKMSEASRTNKLHSSGMSRDDSKHNKESSKQKLRIDEQFDDVADFTDHNMEQCSISEIGDNFYLAFENQKNTHIPGEMVLYYNEAQSHGNTMRLYNDGRSVIGHRTPIKQIHYIQHQEGTIPATQKLVQDQQNNDQQNKKQSLQQIEEQQEKKVENKQQLQQEKKPEVFLNQKSKTQPHLPEGKDQIPQEKKVQKDYPEEIISEPHSDLNLVSNLNYHTLYILKPLSQQEIKRIIYIVSQTNTIACLQFLPQNPNPKIKIYNRQQLVENKNQLLPIERFIEKQIEDGEYEQCIFEDEEKSQKICCKKINDICFNHFYFERDSQKLDDQRQGKAIKLLVDELLDLEGKLNKQIGYNLVFTNKYLLVVAITQPYKIYGNTSLYLDGLAYLGYVCIAKITEGFQMKKKPIDSGESIRQILARCSGLEQIDGSNY